MEDPYSASLSGKSSKFDRQIHHIVPTSISEYNIRDWLFRVSPRNGHFAYGTRGKITHCGNRVVLTSIFIVMTPF